MNLKDLKIHDKFLKTKEYGREDLIKALFKIDSEYAKVYIENEFNLPSMLNSLFERAFYLYLNDELKIDSESKTVLRQAYFDLHIEKGFFNFKKEKKDVK